MIHRLSLRIVVRSSLFCLCVVSLIASLNNSVFAFAGSELWRLPYTAGVTLTLDQGYNGSFSHNIKGAEYALDIQGDNLELAATRSGYISALSMGGKWDQWCTSGIDCFKKGDISRGNHIAITHSDGSVS